MNRRLYTFKCFYICLIMLCCTHCVHAQGAAFEWVKKMGSNSAVQGIFSEEEQGNAITVDKDGNVYTTGTFRGTADFDPGPATFNLVAAGDRDIFISKLDPAGALIWAIRFGSTGNDEGMGITTDTAGNVYITGKFEDTVDFDSGAGIFNLTSMGVHDIFITKLDASGAHIWTKQVGGDDEQWANAIAVDKSGNVYTTGWITRTTPATSGTADFDPGPGVYNLTSNAYNNAFILKLDASGNFVWAKQIEAGNSEGYGIVLSDGYVYTAGGFSSYADMDPSPAATYMFHTLIADVYILKLDTAGNFVWARQIGGDNINVLSFCFATSIALDAQENVFTSGPYFGDPDFDPDTTVNYNLPATGISEGFLSKLNAAGHFSWAKVTSGTSAINFGYAVATDLAGNVYATGEFSETTNFYNGLPNGTLTAAGNKDIYIAKLAPAGSLLWVKKMGGSDNDQGHAIATDHSGNIYTTGYFKNTVDFDPASGTFNLTADGSSDIFVHKMICADTNSSVLTITACSFTFDGHTYTTSGVYTVQLPNISGCDSTVIIDLTVNAVNPVISVSGFVLGTLVPYASYQWRLNGTVIPGANAANYTIVQNGDYSVVVTSLAGCTDTSDVYKVSNFTGIWDVAALAAQINAYPNPAKDMIYIQAPVKVNLILTNIEGKVILQSQGKTAVSMSGLSDGIYLLQVRDTDGVLLKTEKVVKQSR
jgi:hypothetical protein